MDVVTRRLGQFAAAWLGSFVLVFLLTMAATSLLGMELVDTADLLLPVALAALALAAVAGVVLTFARPGGVGAKVLVLILAVLLFLPLLWAPVVATVLAARLLDVPIEYSQAYAWFRITVSNLLYPLISAVVSGAAVRWVWELFQVVATIVGAFASAIQVWNFIKRLTAPAPLEA